MDATKLEKTEPFSVRLNQDDKERLDAYAIDNNISRTFVVRKLITEFLDTVKPHY